MKVYSVFSLESPHRGDSNEYTQYTIFNMKKKNTLNHPKSAAMGFFHVAQEWVRNSCGKWAISVRATEVLLYYRTCLLQKKNTNLCQYTGARMEKVPQFLTEQKILWLPVPKNSLLLKDLQKGNGSKSFTSGVELIEKRGKNKNIRVYFIR